MENRASGPWDAAAEHEGGAETFHILSIGWSAQLITSVLDRIEARTTWRFSHLIVAERDAHTPAARTGKGAFLYVRGHAIPPKPDLALLASLEGPGIPTVHNMIMSDRVVRTLSYDDATAYATYLAKRFDALFRELRPSVVIGGFDGLHSAMGLAVARKLGVPWFAMTFSALPLGLSAFCTGLSPNTAIPILPMPEHQLQQLARETVSGFRNRSVVVPAYLSANSLRTVLARLPDHARAFARAARSAVRGGFDRFTDYSIGELLAQYLRKRRNLLRLPTSSFLADPPSRPYIFLGLHMQPESSIDVWAPFFANQASVIETLARATPPTHQCLIKLHKSDADNYSRSQLAALAQLPGVRIVSPFAHARSFIDGAALVVAIQGTLALEAALLGKPVIMFGDARVLNLPSVSKAGVATELPALIRRKLAEPTPSDQAIIDGLMECLRPYSLGCDNDWQFPPTEEGIGHLIGQFEALRRHLGRETRPLHGSVTQPLRLPT